MKGIKKTENRILSPSPGTIVFLGDTPVLILRGCYTDSTYGRVSNFWYWREVNEDGSLSEEKHGYGGFFEAEGEYEVISRVVIKETTV